MNKLIKLNKYAKSVFFLSLDPARISASLLLYPSYLYAAHVYTAHDNINSIGV